MQVNNSNGETLPCLHNTKVGRYCHTPFLLFHISPAYFPIHLSASFTFQGPSISLFLPTQQDFNWYMMLINYWRLSFGLSKGIQFFTSKFNVYKNLLAWRLPWTEEPDRLQSTGSQSRTWLSDFTFTFCLSVSNCLFSSVAQLCPTLCNLMNCSTPGLPVDQKLPELTQTHVHWVCDAIQPSHPLSSPSPSLNLSQHQGLFQ